LVELVSGAQTSAHTIESLSRLAEKMGKTPVVARDTPGFIVNRVARPLYGEALRLLGEGVATHEQIDRIVEEGGGFRMGPFRLMDLIGIDINYAATQSVYEQTFGEPRYRPHLIQAQMVQQKTLGRKTGQGFYSYEERKPIPNRSAGDRPSEPTASQPGRPASKSILSGPGNWAPGIEAVCEQHGYLLHSGVRDLPIIAGMARAGRGEPVRVALLQLDQALPSHRPLLCQCADVTVAEMCTWVEHPRRLVGFDGLFFAGGNLATLVASPILDPEIKREAEELIRGLGKELIWVEDSPAMVLPRIISMLANEAAFAVGEGAAEATTIDRAMQLGANYPRGPLDWARETGYNRIVSVLDHLRSEFGEDRYRAAPLLRKWARYETLESGPHAVKEA